MFDNVKTMWMCRHKQNEHYGLFTFTFVTYVRRIWFIRLQQAPKTLKFTFRFSFIWCDQCVAIHRDATKRGRVRIWRETAFGFTTYLIDGGKSNKFSLNSNHIKNDSREIWLRVIKVSHESPINWRTAQRDRVSFAQKSAMQTQNWSWTFRLIEIINQFIQWDGVAKWHCASAAWVGRVPLRRVLSTHYTKTINYIDKSLWRSIYSYQFDHNDQDLFWQMISLPNGSYEMA